MRRIFLALAMLLSLCGWASAQDAPEVELRDAAALFERWEAEAAHVESELDVDALEPERADQLRAILEPQRPAARQLGAAAEAGRGPLQEELTALGPRPEEGSEDPDIATSRTELETEIERLDSVVRRSEQAFVRADLLIERIGEVRRQRFADRLRLRQSSPLDPRNWPGAVSALSGLGTAIGAETRDPVAQEWRAILVERNGIMALAAILLALTLLIAAQRIVLRRLRAAVAHLPRQDKAGATRLWRVLLAVAITLTRLALPLLALAALRYAVDLLGLVGPVGQVIADRLIIGAAIYAAAHALIFALFAPDVPALRINRVDDATARATARRARWVGIAVALDYALTGALKALDVPHEALGLVNLGVLLFGGWALWRFIGFVRPEPEEETEQEEGEEESESWFGAQLMWIAHTGGRLIAIASPVLAAAGFLDLSRYLFTNTVITGALIALAVLIFYVAAEACEALSEMAVIRRSGTRSGASGASGVGKTEGSTGGLLPVFIGFLLTLAAIPLVALVWGASTTDLEETYLSVSEGLTIGETTFRPGDILIAALVFGAGLFITRLIQAVLRRAVLPRTRLDMGARSSILSGLGYLGFFVSAIIAIGAGGLDLTNLAFLGAALGVGIGFGLQNIVNNFVSGIILLVERPIKVGDWIEVAGTHGTVSRINVRSTEITTFDKASYIVPNSEFISGSVTNYTHGDLTGRVICPVGVAYGTDTRRVEKILLEIARAHPMVLRKPAPFVVFQGFGDSALDFELRAYLRDVNWVLTVRSDINFEIEQRLREEGIEIPFPQRDINLRQTVPPAQPFA